MKRDTINPWLTRYAVFTAVCALALIGLGGLVTSKGAGMAVPDWPTTYGYNMFLFPISQWVGGIFYEHTHRLFASFVGLLTTILAVWLWLKESRRWLRWLGVAAFVMVVGQGILGGLRVTLLKDELGIFHAAIAQLFLALVTLIALWTSRWWQRLGLKRHSGVPRRFFSLGLIGSALIFGQLVLGATMRHEHAGLAVPDFPSAYGHVWPPMDQASIEVYNQNRMDVRDYGDVAPYQIRLHMGHRVMALVILGFAGYLLGTLYRQVGGRHLLMRLGWVWALLLLVQSLLGAITIWSDKAADIATAHVVVGALSLNCVIVLSLLTWRLAVGDTVTEAVPEKSAEGAAGDWADVASA